MTRKKMKNGHSYPQTIEIVAKRSKIQRKMERLRMANERRDDFQKINYALPNLIAKPVPEWNPVIEPVVETKPTTTKKKTTSRPKIVLEIREEKKRETLSEADSFKLRHKHYISSTAWKRVKQKYRSDSSRYQNCWGCGVPEKMRPHHFHHIHYDTFTKETLDDIIPVCQPCHTLIHQTHQNDKTKSLRFVTWKICEATIQERNLLTQSVS